MQANAPTAARVLVVADWMVDARAVVTACAQRGDAFVLTVPAWLHGLDWAGDPGVSVPCAQRQLETISELGREAGLDIAVGGVGDPDPLSAIGDTLDTHSITEVLLFTRSRRLGLAHPFDLEHRAQRLTGVPVRRISVPAAQG